MPYHSTVYAGQKVLDRSGRVYFGTTSLEISREKKPQPTRAFREGILNFRKQVAGIKRKAVAGRASEKKQWRRISGKEIARRIAVKITPSCCLSEKWRIINLLDDIWMLLPEVESLGEKLEEAHSVTSVAAEFGIAHSIVSRLWRQFQTTGTAIRGFSSGCPRGTTLADDRYIVLQARRNRRQTAGEIARHTTQATGRPISRFTVARRLHGGGLFARRPVRCVPLTPAHRRRRSLCCREHRNWRDNEWGRVLFTDESRFSLSSDSHRILIWRERGSRNHPSNIIERDRYGGRGVLVWGGIMLGSRTDLHIFDAGSVNGTRYCNEILLPYVRLFRGAMGLQFLFMDDNAPCHCTVAAEQLLESEDIERMDWPARSPDLNPIEHVWDFLGRRLAARTLPPVMIRELLLALLGLDTDNGHHRIIQSCHLPQFETLFFGERCLTIDIVRIVSLIRWSGERNMASGEREEGSVDPCLKTL
ncbi:transposable element Tc1 transposase [Trichonephila clavipes]|nr:transposable element Tc1 transposase [Trichonephila clavipes]